MKIRYFAWLKEETGISSEDIVGDKTIANVADLVEHLRSRSDGHARALSDMKLVRVAVNHDYSDLGHVLRGDEEIAFFPPVTGG